MCDLLFQIAPVAQLDRALDFESKGRAFKSRQARNEAREVVLRAGDLHTVIRGMVNSRDSRMHLLGFINISPPNLAIFVPI